jgi:hypothetical protein
MHGQHVVMHTSTEHYFNDREGKNARGKIKTLVINVTMDDDGKMPRSLTMCSVSSENYPKKDTRRDNLWRIYYDAVLICIYTYRDPVITGRFSLKFTLTGVRLKPVKHPIVITVGRDLFFSLA